MSKTLAKGLVGIIKGTTGWMGPSRQTMTRGKVMEFLDPVLTVRTANATLRFSCPTARATHDPDHMFTDEPETTRWLDTLPAGDLLWDIGANVGTYTIYAAVERKLRVLAFEPNAASYAVLCRNVELNPCEGRVDALCVALADRTRLDRLYMGASSAGHSMHAFGTSKNIYGEIPNPIHQAVLGYSIDDFITVFASQPPDHIKLDVDSIEDLIIDGGQNTLTNHVKSILVEVVGDDLDEKARRLTARMEGLGLYCDTAFIRPGDSRNVLYRRPDAT